MGEHRVVGVGLDPLGDEQGVLAPPGPLVEVEQAPHLVRGLEVVARAVEPEAGGVVQVLAHADGQKGVVRGGLALVDVVRVVGHQRRDVQLAADLEQAVADLLLDGHAVVHQLQEDVLLAEDVLEPGGVLDGLLLLPQPQPGLHTARRTPGRDDDALAVLRHEVQVHAGLHVVALHGRQRGHLEEVAQPGRVLRQHRHVQETATAGDVLATLARGVVRTTGPTPEHPLLVEARLRRDVGLDADDGLDARALGLLVELVGPEHVAVVGHGDRRHLQPRGLLEQGLQLGGAVQHRVLGVDVQMGERVGHGSGAPRRVDGRVMLPSLRLSHDSRGPLWTTDRARITKTRAQPPEAVLDHDLVLTCGPTGRRNPTHPRRR